MIAEYPMHVLSFGFQPDVTSCGRHIRISNVIDKYKRTALAIISRRSFRDMDLVAVVERFITETDIQPAFLRCDSGPEITAGMLADWYNTVGVRASFIDSSSPWQNGFIESFNAQFRREQLSEENLDTIVEAKYLADEWK